MKSQGATKTSHKVLPEISKDVGDPRTKSKGKRVLICRPNHRLGNLLLITPLVQEIAEAFPDCKIDLFVKGGLGSIVFKNYENVDTIIQLPKRPLQHLLKYIQCWISIRKHRYDIVIDADKKSSSGRLSFLFAKSKDKIPGNIIEDIDRKYKDYKHHAKFPVYNFRNYLTEIGFAQKDTPMPSVNLKLSPFEIARGKELLDQLTDKTRQTISIFTYATGKKCYSESWWEAFYQRLQTEFLHLNIVEVLPVENISKLSFKAPSFYSKDVREIGSFIANTLVFVAADSGIMHLGSSSQTPTVGLFSVTDPTLYEPYNDGSVAMNTNIVDTDECILLIRDIIDRRFR
jgi:ADP-heptose:LPS heptosyltransferase